MRRQIGRHKGLLEQLPAVLLVLLPAVLCLFVAGAVFTEPRERGGERVCVHRLRVSEHPVLGTGQGGSRLSLLRPALTAPALLPLHPALLTPCFPDGKLRLVRHPPRAELAESVEHRPDVHDLRLHSLVKRVHFLPELLKTVSAKMSCCAEVAAEHGHTLITSLLMSTSFCVAASCPVEDDSCTLCSVDSSSPCLLLAIAAAAFAAF